MQSEKMWEIFERCIEDYHQKDDVDARIDNPCEEEFSRILYHKCWIDTIQWHLEDIIRDPSIAAEDALRIKRRIDKSNQERTDMVEKLDDHFLQLYADISLQDDARLNTESPAWAIDRLSILALKIYHMKIEAGRRESEAALLEKNAQRLQLLLTQKEDLLLSINQLLEDLQNGRRIMKVYRQVKMYNDPKLNPVLYSQKEA